MPSPDDTSPLDYADTPHAIREDLRRAHIRAWDRLARPGTWLTGEMRVQVMAETRHAQDCRYCAEIKAAPSPYTVTGAHDHRGELPENRADMIHRIAADPGRLTHGWYRRTLESGIADAEYVEIVSIIAQTTAVDTFARGMGLPLRPLPEPQPGEPSCYRPAEARQHEAWAPNIAKAEHGPNEADYFTDPEANIRRALTLVPDEARGFFELVFAQYLDGEQMLDFSQEFRVISHAQIELLASRVSAINQCTY